MNGLNKGSILLASLGLLIPVATIGLSTTAHAAAQASATPTLRGAPVTGTTVVGNPISDNATLTGSSTSPVSGGTLLFRLYAPGVPCQGTALFSSVVAVAGDGTYNSGAFTPPAAGTYNWVVTYSGDAANVGATSSCATEESIVTQAAPALTTAPQPPTAAA